MPKQLLVWNGMCCHFIQLENERFVYLPVYPIHHATAGSFEFIQYAMLNGSHDGYNIAIVCTVQLYSCKAVHSLCINRNYSKCSTKIDLFAGNIFWISSEAEVASIYSANVNGKLVGSVWFLFLFIIYSNWFESENDLLHFKIDFDGCKWIFVSALRYQSLEAYVCMITL